MARPHIPVLSQEIADLFHETKLSRFVDATLGAAGHASRLLTDHLELDQFIGFDQDADALELAQAELAPFAPRVQLVHSNFRNFADQLDQLGVGQIDGAMVDLGISSMQLDWPEKGFSFQQEGPLDMRMDRRAPLTAAQIVNEWPESEIGRILRDYGELPNWRPIASQIVRERDQKPFETTGEFTRRLEKAAARGHHRKIHPMTLLFQALRIAVNDEFGALEALLPQVVARLRPGGRLAIISFHSLEDGIVKRFFRDQAASRIFDPTSPMGSYQQKPTLQILTKKPIEPSREEIRANPRSRSARLRAAEKLS